GDQYCRLSCRCDSDRHASAGLDFAEAGSVGAAVCTGGGSEVMSEIYFEKNTPITGIGQSEISRGSSKSALELTVDACMDAIQDAGLRRENIDGIATWPGADYNTSGFSPVGIAHIQDALRLKVRWY